MAGLALAALVHKHGTATMIPWAQDTKWAQNTKWMGSPESITQASQNHGIRHHSKALWGCAGARNPAA